MEDSSGLFAGITHKRMVTLVIEQITDAILEARLKPNDKIPPEQELAGLLKVGRSTVREALKAVETLGLITRSNEGTYVTVPESESLTRLFQCFVVLKGISFTDLIEFRLMMETRVAEMLASRATEEDLEYLESLLESASNSGESLEKKGKAYVDFHLELARRTRNGAIMEVFNMLRPVLMQSQLITLMDPGLREGGADAGHRTVLNAIRARNPAKAGKAMEDHIRQVLTSGTGVKDRPNS